MNYRNTLITALLIVCALCSTQSFAEVVEKKGYHYDINKEEKVAIGTAVTSIGDNSFVGCCTLVSITIGRSVSSIGSSAFSGCSKLSSIIIPNSVTAIGAFAFSNFNRI